MTNKPLLSQFLLSAMGSPHPLQVDGVGGGVSLTSKVAIVTKSYKPGSDVDYMFAQVKIDDPIVKYQANCGNILSGVGPFAILRDLIEREGQDPRNTVDVRVWNTNTATRSVVTVPVKLDSSPRSCKEGEPEAVIDYKGRKSEHDLWHGLEECSHAVEDDATNAKAQRKLEVEFSGDTIIDGVPGTASEINVSLWDVLGAKTGKIFPTGSRVNYINGIPVTCIDSGNPVVLVKADEFGEQLLVNSLELSHSVPDPDGDMTLRNPGYADPDSLNRNVPLLERLEEIRCQASKLMGLGDATGKNLPKVMLLSEPQTAHGSICSRYFVPDKCHSAHAITGAVAIATATTFEGTVADGIVKYTQRRMTPTETAGLNMFGGSAAASLPPSETTSPPSAPASSSSLAQDRSSDESSSSLDTCLMKPALRKVIVEHPSGAIVLELVLDTCGSKVGKTTGAPVAGRVISASVVRTARPVMDGDLFVKWSSSELDAVD
jgi:2-methylaconitate cis-trans-isomerase PrpF